MIELRVAVEGPLDEEVVLRLLQEVPCSRTVNPRVYVRGGKSRLLEKIGAYNQSAQHGFPWFVLVDLNSDGDCAPQFLQEHLPELAQFMCFRVAVRTVESWLLADRVHLAAFLRIRQSQIPKDPENLNDPKRTLIDLARVSRRRDIREGLVPREGSSVGPAYTSRMGEFVREHWDPQAARSRSPSLDRAIRCLEALLQHYRNTFRLKCENSTR